MLTTEIRVNRNVLWFPYNFNEEIGVPKQKKQRQFHQKSEGFQFMLFMEFAIRGHTIEAATGGKNHFRRFVKERITPQLPFSITYN